MPQTRVAEKGSSPRLLGRAPASLAFAVAIGTALMLLPRDVSATNPPTEGLITCWSFDQRDGGRVQDGSGNEHHGKTLGDPVFAEGVRGQSLRLHGRVDYVAVADAEDLDFSDATFSVAAWVNVYTRRGDQQMIVGKNVYSANQREWGLMVDADWRFRFYLQHDKRWNTVQSQTVPVLGQWYHVTVTLDAGRASLFVNGNREAQAELGESVPNTEAPLTIGGINDGGRLRQMMLGAVDEVRLYNRALSAEDVAGMHFPVTATHAVPADTRYGLWDAEQPVPTSAACPLLEGVEFVVVKPHVPEVDGYDWLHGVAICWHKDKLYASFGHNEGKENTATEIANGCRSDDGGKTWGPLFAIDDGDTANPAVSHGVLLSHAGELWAFQGAFHDVRQKVHTRAYLLDEASGRWEAQGVVAEDGFWPMQEPLKMDDGNWIMAGISVGGGYGGPDNPAAVAISHGDDFTRWDVVIVPKPANLTMWGESTVFVNGAKVLNISRWGRPIALAASSEDYGRTWTEIRQSNLPMAGSKPYTGVLSTGQRYLVCTTTADSGNRRSPLTIAVSRPGAEVFSRVYRIRDAVHDGPGESGPECRLSYPYSVERDGKLYVVYSNCGGRGGNRNSAELAIIPVEALQIE